MPDTPAIDQQQIAGWFDATYRRLGARYLRPPAAYPIYLQLLDARPGHRLLDVACGAGLLLEAADRRQLSAVGIDIAPAALELARARAPRAALARANAEALPLPSSSVDRLTCIGSLERVLDRRRALGEIRRVLRPDGRACIMVRNADSISWRLWRRGLRRQNVRGGQDAGTLDTWRALFEERGFSVDDVLPDQWLRQRLRRWLRPWRGAPDAERGEPVARGILPLRSALEFIFLLRRDAASP